MAAEPAIYQNRNSGRFRSRLARAAHADVGE